MFQFRLRSLLLIVTALAALFGPARHSLSPYYEIGRAELPGNRRIVVEGERFHDEGKNLRYYVRDGSSVVLHQWLCLASGSLNFVEFDVLTQNNGNLVLLCDVRTPDSIVIMHDFTSGYSYPAHEAEPWNPSPRAKKLVEIFKSKYPGRSFEFSARIHDYP